MDEVTAEILLVLFVFIPFEWLLITTGCQNKHLRDTSLFSLEKNEVIQERQLAYKGNRRYVLVLTNIHIILIPMLGLVRQRTGEAEYIQLAKIKNVNGSIQVVKNGRLSDIYLQDGNVLSLRMPAVLRKKIIKQAEQVQKTGYNPKNYAIPGVAAAARTIKATVDIVDDTFHMESVEKLKRNMRPVFCQDCGAKFEAPKGHTVPCPYCGVPQHVQ